MFRTKTVRRTDRRGMILMVVLAMLALFAIVGLGFVLVSENSAMSARIDSNALTGKGEEQPDPQRAFSYYLGAQIYGVPDDATGVQSGLRGHGLADTTFPRDARVPNGVIAGVQQYRTNAGGYPYLSAFSGTGLFKSAAAGEVGDAMTMPYPPGGSFGYNRFQVVNYAVDPNTGLAVDPEWQWFRSGAPGTAYNALGDPAGPYAFPGTMAQPAPIYRSQAAPYTFPDCKDIYLAVLDHTDPSVTPQTTGRVLQPSYYRSYDDRNPSAAGKIGPFMPDPAVYGVIPGVVTGLEPQNPNWFSFAHRMAIIRPRPADQLTPAELQTAIGQQFLPINPTPAQITNLQNAIALAANGPNGIFPAPQSAGGDVKNLSGTPGENDSLWVYAGGPVLMYKGKPYVSMIAPMIIDLSARVNLSTAGNSKQTVTDPQSPPTSFPPSGTLMPLDRSHASFGGYWPGEVSPLPIFNLVPDNSPSPPQADVRKGQRALLQLLGGGRVGVPYGVQTAAGRFGLDANVTAYPNNPGSVVPPADPLTGKTSATYNAGLLPPHYARANLTGAGTGASDRLDPVGTGASPFPTYAATRFPDTSANLTTHAADHPAQLNPDYLPQGGTGGRVFSFTDLRKLVMPNRASDKPINQGNSYAYYYGQTDVGTLAPWQLASGKFGAKGSTNPYPDRTFNPNNPQGADYGNPTPTTDDPAQLVRMLVTTFSTSMSRPEVALLGATPMSGATPVYRLGPVDLTKPLHDFRVDTTQPLSQANLLPPVPNTVDPFMGWNDDATHSKYLRYALARRDRQNLARDIFLRLVGIADDQLPAANKLLDGTKVWYEPPYYTAPSMTVPAGAAGGGYLGFGTAMNAPSAATISTLRALAQVAANMVDYLDPDDLVTPFVWWPMNSAYADSTLAFVPAGSPPGTTPLDPSFLGDPSADPSNFTATNVGNHVVYGTELPRVVVNEVYAMLGNNSADLPPNNNGGAAAKNAFLMKFWLELHNPLGMTGDPVLSDGGSARLQYPQFDNPTGGAKVFDPYAVHQVVVAYSAAGTTTEFSQALTAANGGTNVTGDPGLTAMAGQVKLRVQDYSTPGTPAPMAGVDTKIVQPAAGAVSGPPGNNQGYYVLGPENAGGATPADGFPGTDVNCTLRLQNAPPADPFNSMAYDTGTFMDADRTGGMNLVGRTHTVILRRLANPYVRPNDPAITTGLFPYNAALPANPYITVDYVEGIPVRDQVYYNETGLINGRTVGTPATTEPSVGRRHPYTARAGGSGTTATAYSDAAADMNQFLTRQSGAAGATDPQNSFFSKSNPFTNGADLPRWLVHLDRQPLNAVELAHVSVSPPALLTQTFGSTTGGAAGALSGERYNTHSLEAALMPGLPNGQRKFDQFVMTPFTAGMGEVQKSAGFLNAALGLLTTRPAYSGAPVGGREHGRISYNTAARAEVFKALFDQNDGNYFTAEDAHNVAGRSAMPPSADGFWDRVTGDTTAQPTRDFSKGAPIFGIGGTTTPTTSTVLQNGGPNNIPFFFNNSTFPNSAAAGSTVPSDTSHAQALTEPLRKAWNSSTATSNSFLVIATVSFFELRDPDGPGGPLPPGPAANGRLYFGKELIKEVPGDFRQQYVSIVDRSGLGVELDRSSGTSLPTGLQALPAPQDGGKVWFTALAEDAMPGATQITVMAKTDNPTGASFSATTGTNAYVYAEGARVPLLGRSVVIGFGDKDVADGKGDGEVVGLPQQPANVTAPATVTQVASGANGVMTIQLPFGTVIQKYHAAGSPVTNVTLGHPGPQTGFDVNHPRYRAVVPYTVQVTPAGTP